MLQLLPEDQYIEAKKSERRMGIDPVRAATIGPFAAAMDWSYRFAACISKPKNSNGVSPLTQPCQVFGLNRMTSSGL